MLMQQRVPKDHNSQLYIQRRHLCMKPRFPGLKHKSMPLMWQHKLIQALNQDRGTLEQT
ncbi:unnamed protein product [Musa banksii]